MQVVGIRDLIREMSDLGYRRGAPSLEVAEMDGQIARYQCECGAIREYIPFVREREDGRQSYRAFSYCWRCGDVHEF